jgi:hypothetical protein
MLDGKAYKILLSHHTEPDLIPRMRDPALLEAFAALADDLKTIVDQIAAGNDLDRRGSAQLSLPL